MTQEPIYDVNYFIAKFSAIPDKEWLTGVLVNASNTARCALGHCCPDYIKVGFETPDDQTYEARELSRLFMKSGLYVSKINDWNDRNYQQGTPKLRILAALEDIKKKQDAERLLTTTETIPAKEKIRYVSVPETISKQTKELILS